MILDILMFMAVVVVAGLALLLVLAVVVALVAGIRAAVQVIRGRK